MHQQINTQSINHFVLSVQKQLKTYQIQQLLSQKTFNPCPENYTGPWPHLLILLETALMHRETWYKKHQLQIIDPVLLFLSEFYLKNKGHCSAQPTVLYSPSKQQNLMQYYTYALQYIILQLYVEEARKWHTVSTNKLWLFM